VTDLPPPVRHHPLLGRGQILALALSDLGVLALCAVAAWWVKSLQNPNLPLEQYLHILPIFLGSAGTAYASFGLYPALGFGPADELRRLTQSTTLVFLAGVALTFISKAGESWSRQIFMAAWLAAMVAVPISRAAVRRLLCRRPWWGIPCVVLGAGRTGEQVAGLLATRPWLGLRPVSILDDDPAVPKGNVIVRNIIRGGGGNVIEDAAKPGLCMGNNLEQADPRGVGTGEGPAAVTEQFALD
jgi:FlaA1/EpsC-like NDP-sugar epimerase